MDIYIVNMDKHVELEGTYQNRFKTSHRYVIAPSFESALSVVRKAHPEHQIKGVSKQNHSNGQPVLFAESVKASEV